MHPHITTYRRKIAVVLCALVVGTPATAADTEAPALSREMLVGRSFRFRWKQADRGGVNGVATLRQDGTIAGIRSPNESTWLVDAQGRLVFKHANGTVSTVFDKVHPRGDKLFFEGPFQLEKGIVHLLEQVDTPQGERSEIDALNELVAGYSKQRIFELDVGRSLSFGLNDGTQRVIRLVSAQESRDRVIGLVRRADVAVEIDGEPLRLVCGPYVMPVEVDGLRIQADTTSGWSRIGGRVQFSVWDASDPLVDTARFAFPLPDYRLLSHGTQAYNEAVYLGRGDGDPAGGRFCHDYGFDLAGYEGRQVVASCADGEVLFVRPSRDHPASVVIRDRRGWAWHYGHLASVAASVKSGASIRKGEPLGMLGRTGPSGNYSHLHLGTYLSDAHIESDRANRRLNLYPWLVAAYQKHCGGTLLAVARPHRTVTTGETVLLDGSHCIAAAAKVTSYRWRLPDGTIVDRRKVETAFDKPGVYVAILRVKDDKGREDVDFCRVKVFSENPAESRIPTIFMSHAPAEAVTVGQPISFRLWLQKNNAGPMRVDFGDGTIVEDYKSYARLDHAFRTPGIHIVTAHAVADGLPITQCQKVVVSAPSRRR